MKDGVFMSTELKVGWAEIEITPEGRAELFGQYYQRVAEEVHLPLSAWGRINQQIGGFKIPDTFHNRRKCHERQK